jgi:hypothetical protein
LSSDHTELFNIDLCGQMAAGVVLDYRLLYGEGPAWAQLAGIMGWGPPREHGQLIYLLRDRGWLTFTEEPYSLRPGPRYQAVVGDA